jgi:hypothetical protein
VNENIIEINVPNAISIVLMAAIGALIIGAVKKLLNKSGQATTGKGANTTLYGMAS